VALNEPGETDFGDSRKVKVATLPPVSREQLKDDPNFRDLPAIPEIGMTVTLAELMRCPHTLLVVPFRSKAEIVRRFFESEVDPALPATIVKRKPGVVMYLDAASFALCDNLGLERLS
jgi:glucosamine-6-phosphate deaminase